MSKHIINQSAKVYKIYPGIEVGEINIKGKSYSPAVDRRPNIIEISYCLKGRSECRMSDGCFQYMGEGDLFISREDNHSTKQELPLGYYQGLKFVLDLDVLASQTSGIITDLPVNISAVISRLLSQCDCFLLTARQQTENLFGIFFTLPEEARPAYYRLKAAELILFLNYLDVESERSKKTYTSPQVEVIKKIHNYLLNNIETRLTIAELSKQFCISQTTLKTNFKAVYGQSIMTHLKGHRIRYAAKLLTDSQKSIAEIAADVGYESQSKFGVAFKEIMKVSPLEHRKKTSSFSS